MELPIRITFRGMGYSDAIEAAIRDRAAKLEDRARRHLRRGLDRDQR